MGVKIISQNSSLRSRPTGKQLQIRAEDDVTLGVYSSRRSGFALDYILQSWAKPCNTHKVASFGSSGPNRCASPPVTTYAIALFI